MKLHMDLTTLGKWLCLAGVGLVGLGMLVWLAGKAGVPLGRLPGDIRIERAGWAFYLPLVTCLVGSLGLTVAVNLVLRLLKH